MAGKHFEKHIREVHPDIETFYYDSEADKFLGRRRGETKYIVIGECY